MLSPASTGYAFNRTRNAYLATHLSVAGTHWLRLRGLMLKDAANFPQGEGLWIVPCESVHTFGMKFPIDLVYLDRNKKVKKVRSAVPPWRLSVCFSAHSVLELASGSIRRTGTKPGDKLQFSAALPPSDC